MISTEAARRVASRYAKNVVSSQKGIHLLLNYILKELGGVEWVVRFFNRRIEDYDEDYDDGGFTWDKDRFYRKGGAEEILEALLRDASKADLEKWMESALQRANSYTEAYVYDNRSVELDFEGDHLVLKLDIGGPLFSRYGSGDDDHDSEDPFDYVEDPGSDADISDDVQKFINYMGGSGYPRGRRRDAEGAMGSYDFYLYATEVTFKQSFENLVRVSFGRFVEEAAQKVQWPGKKAPDVKDIPNRAKVEIQSKRGEWSSDLKKGVRLDVLRGGDVGDILKIGLPNGASYKLLKLGRTRRKELSLYEPRKPDTYLVVKVV